MPAALPHGAPKGRNIVLGAGKAAAEMAAVANRHLLGETSGLVVTRDGHGAALATGDIEVIEAAHPVPDERSLEAANRMLDLAMTATRDDRVVFLISGGGSALLCAPIAGVTVEQKQNVTRFLLQSGARIDEINCVRKHLSRVKGGGLAHAAAAAELVTLAISDVVGDALSDIASGPSVVFRRCVDSAREILEKYGYDAIEPLVAAMRKAEPIAAPEHPAKVVASARVALDAIVKQTEADGWMPILVGDDIEGDATEVGRRHAELARQYRQRDVNVALVSGGELTVKVKNREGRGGPNLEYLASLMIGLNGAAGIEAMACDSDGIDGSEDNAGACISSTSLKRAAQLGIDPAELLRTNNSYTLFEALGDLVVTGPTGTNINDIRVILVGPGNEV